MKYLCAALAVFAWLGCVAAAEPKRPVLVTGEVIALNSQPILVPVSNGSPTLLRNFVAEGTAVKRGDLVLRIDAANDGMSISQQEAELEQAQTKAQRETSDLAVKSVEAHKELLAAEAAVKKARVDAALPRNLVPAIDFDRYQGELLRTQRELEVKQQALANARAAVERRRADADLEAKKLRFNVQFSKSLELAAEVYAERDGVIVHTYSDWRSERFDEGTSAHPGTTVGYVVGSGRMQVRAWALEADRSFLAPDQQVRLSFDALPQLSLIGTVERIANAPQARAAWGNGRYFQVDIALPADAEARLVPGMSALVEPLTEPVSTSLAVEQRSAVLQLEGEIASRSAIPISPPRIPEVWQFNLVSLPPEGTRVQAGQPIATFDVADLRPKLDSKQSLLKEKLRALEKLELDHREGTRAADIDVAEANSNLEKAQRKVSQPSDQIRRIDYDKLVIEHALAQELAQVAMQHRGARAQARAAERAELDAAIARLKLEITQIEESIASLAVTAKQPGMVLYRLQFNGEKFAIGNQVFRGISVATLADPQQLLVRATVPEAQAAAVRVGQRARINVPGANVALGARVSALGHIYHIKSRAQPVIVRDVELAFDVMPKGVKPGAAVQIALTPSQSIPSQPLPRPPLPGRKITAARTSGIASAP
jgi:multidrug resistance efflux pump